MSRKAADQSRAARTAALLEGQKRKERTRNAVVITAIVGVLVAILGVGFLISRGGDDSVKAAEKNPKGMTDGYGIVIGQADAPDTVTIYEDPQCPICAAFEAQSRDMLEQGLADGKIKVDYRIVSFLDSQSGNEYSSRAANALVAAYEVGGEDVFKKFHDYLYANQPSEGGDGHEDAELIKQAVAAGADKAKITPEIEDKVYGQYLVNATDQMSKDGVTGTPTVFINGKKVDGNPQEALDAISKLVSE